MEKDTIRAVFDKAKDYYCIISLTDNYCLYLEGLDGKKEPLVNNFSLDKVEYLKIELNDYYGNFYVAIQDYKELQDITLDTDIDYLKDKVFDLAINKSIL